MIKKQKIRINKLIVINNLEQEKEKEIKKGNFFKKLEKKT